MLGSIYIGLSGMNAFSRGLQTISNNVANLNTPGYKATTVSFTDVFSIGGNGSSFLGSAAQQKGGSGVRLDDPLIDFRQGDLHQTSNDLDLAIQGGGFLVLLNKDNGKTYYARTGQFAVDSDGYISETVTGYRMAVLDASGNPVAINVNAKRTSPPVATTTVTFADNLSSSATQATVSNINVFDSHGGKHVWTVNFAKSVGGEWTVKVTDETGLPIGSEQTLRFIGSVVDPGTARLTFRSNPAGADPLSVTLDFSAGVTSFSAGTTSSLRAASVDGNATGALSSITVDEDGKIKLSYSNEKTELEGAVALADFRDPQQLERVGNGLYRDTGDAQRRLLTSGNGGVGTLLAKQIEASNVNLAQEFGDLILIQRGFQACSQVLSTTNDMIQQLFGVRGQS